MASIKSIVRSLTQPGGDAATSHAIQAPTKSDLSGWALEPEIPPPDINYNISEKSPEKYARTFKEAACLREFPFLMRAANLASNAAIFDYGCGLGPFAYAASKFLSEAGSYFGYEPNQTALKFLKEAYASRPNFHFHGDLLNFDEDYVAIAHDKKRTGGITANQVDLSFVDRPIDGEWSSSVFTHMWTDSIITVLKEFHRIMKPGAPCVNTWLIVDDFAAYVLRSGLADRTLPFKVNDALTYSQENPLVCTAYELPTVEKIYAQAGHEIVDIQFGSWAGRGNGVTYQDIVISRIRE